jgi:UDP-N-acetylglucosamine 2-epimerase (non-hydrolysing)
MKVIAAIGTRPEAIKMAPVIAALKAEPGLETIVCASGQHRDMLQSVLDLFGIAPDIDLGAMNAEGSLNRLMSTVMARFDATLAETKPDIVLVHGDTTTSAACALAAFHRGIRIGHVEAGLRTRDLARPWPEELNRRIVDVAARDLFAPTEEARRNLLAEALGEKNIHVTGNTIVDAVLSVAAKLRADGKLRAGLEKAYGFLDPGKRLVLVTTHRRENFGAPLKEILAALRDIATLPDVEIVLPVHLNPGVRQPVREALSGSANIHLTEPMGYGGLIWLLDRAALVLTDSGGIQEEAPSLGKTVLVMREVTERPEGIAAGFIRLVGTSAPGIVENARRTLAGGDAGLAGRPNPYGDGRAAERIVAILHGETPPPFSPGKTAPSSL